MDGKGRREIVGERGTEEKTKKRERRTRSITSTDQSRLNRPNRTSLVDAASVNFGLRRLGVTAHGPNAGNQRGAREPGTTAAMVSRADCKCLAHDRTAVGKQLQFGHGTAAGGGHSPGAGRRRQGAKFGGRSVPQERAQGLGLVKSGFHGGRVSRNRQLGFRSW